MNMRMTAPGISAPVQQPQPGRQITQSVLAWMPTCGARGQLSGSSTTLYTAPTGTTPTGNTQKAKLKAILLHNTDSVDRTITIYIIESGGSVADNRAMLKAVTIPTGKLWIIEFGDGVTLEGGETVRGLASTANVITYRIDVEEMMLLA